MGAYYPHRVTYHPTCHSLRVLRIGDAPLRLLHAVDGIELADLPGPRSAAGSAGPSRRERGPEPQVVERFVQRLAEYGATARRVPATDLPGALGAACAGMGRAGWRSPGSCRDAGGPTAWSWCATTGSPPELHRLDGAITGRALAMGETGTLALDGGGRSGRRALSLVPDYHLCMVEESQIVDRLPEAIERLEPAARDGRPITLVSGPSATSDIELTRVEGVHGPRVLDVLIAG